MTKTHHDLYVQYEFKLVFHLRQIFCPYQASFLFEYEFTFQDGFLSLNKWWNKIKELFNY